MDEGIVIVVITLACVLVLFSLRWYVRVKTKQAADDLWHRHMNRIETNTIIREMIDEQNKDKLWFLRDRLKDSLEESRDFR